MAIRYAMDRIMDYDLQGRSSSEHAFVPADEEENT